MKALTTSLLRCCVSEIPKYFEFLNNYFDHCSVYRYRYIMVTARCFIQQIMYGGGLVPFNFIFMIAVCQLVCLLCFIYLFLINNTACNNVG